MNKVVIFILLVALLLGGAFFLAFTASGNALFLPYLNSYLKENIEGVKVEILKFSLNPGSLSVVAKVNDTVDLVAQGPVDLIDQSFDLNYRVDAQKIVSSALTIDKSLHIQGKAIGRMEEMHITGSGKAFESDIRYDLNLREKQPQNITLSLKDASISQMLLLAGQKPYAKGRMSIDVNMPTLDPEHPQGEAKLQIRDALVDAALLRQQHNISLPSDTAFGADMTARAEGEMLLAEGEIITSLATLALSETRYHLKSRKLNTSYRLDIPDMAKLRGIVQAPLAGKLALAGNAALEGGSVDAAGITHSLGGEGRFRYRNDTLSASLKEAEAARVLAMIGEPRYLSGKLSGSVELDSVEKLSGKFDFRSKGEAQREVVRKAFDIDPGKEFQYDMTTGGKISAEKVYAQTKLDTTMGKLSMPDMVYAIAPGSLHSSYHLYIPDLRKLQPLTGKQYRGDMDFKGKISKEKDLIITGEGKEFDGSVEYKLVNEKITADVHGVTVSKVMHMLGYPQVLEALSEAKIDYNFVTERGKVDAKLDSARILPNQLTILLKQVLQIDLTRERYNQATFVSTISPAQFDFDFIAQNPVSHIKILDGVLEKKSERITASVDMRYKEKELKAKITGTLDKPRVALDTSSLIKSKLDKKVDTLLDKGLKDQGGGKVKELFKGFSK